MSDRFTGVPRGRPLPGSRHIAGYIWDDPEKWRSVYGLPRDEYGLIDLNGKLTGFTGWIDAALAARAQAGKKRPRRQREAATA